MFSLRNALKRETPVFSAGVDILCLCAIAFLSSGVFAADSYSTWAYSKQLNINTSVANGAAVTGNVYAFPLLVRLNPGDFSTAQFGQCKTDGTDIRFENHNGKHLFYQIERWNATKDSAEIWVNVDTILGDNATQYITMYWGNASAGDSSKPQKVFDTANGYEAAVHFVPTNKDTFLDATYRAYNGTSALFAAFTSVTQPKTVDTIGVIGRGRCNRDSMSAINLQNLGHTFGLVRDSAFISVWIKTRRHFVDSTDNLQVSGIRQYGHVTPMQASLGGVQCALWHPALSITVWGNGSTWNSYFADDNWHYFVYTYDSASGSNFYLDGMILSQDPTYHGYLGTTTEPLRLGSAEGNAANYEWLKAIWDEVVLARKIRSADWIQLCYANQQIDQTLVTTGVINANNFSKTSSGAGVITVKSAGRNITLDFSLAQSGNIVLKMFDLRGKEIRTIARGSFVAGNHQVPLTRDGLSRGIYMIQLQSAQNTVVRSVRLF